MYAHVYEQEHAQNLIDGTLNTCKSIHENKIFREEYPFVINVSFCQLKLIS